MGQTRRQESRTETTRWEDKGNEFRVGEIIQKVKALAPKSDDILILKSYMIEDENGLLSTALMYTMACFTHPTK